MLFFHSIRNIVLYHYVSITLYISLLSYSRFIRIPGGSGSVGENEKCSLYKSDYIILVPLGIGSLPIGLCRELFEVITPSHSMVNNKPSSMFKVSKTVFFQNV